MQPLVKSFLKLVGQGDPAGKEAIARAGQAGWIEVYAWSHAVDSPRDAASGVPTGKPQHGPLVITRPIDQRSRPLMAALVGGEVLAEVVLETWRPTAAAERRRPDAGDLLDLRREEALDIYLDRLRRSRLEEKVALTIRLLDAWVTGIETEMVGGVALEHVAFDYRRISWSWGTNSGELTATRESQPAPQSQPVAPKPPTLTTKEIARKAEAKKKADFVRAAAAKLELVDGNSSCTPQQILQEMRTATEVKTLRKKEVLSGVLGRTLEKRPEGRYRLFSKDRKSLEKILES